MNNNINNNYEIPNNATVVNNPVEFKKQAISYALKELKNKGIITNEQDRNVLYDLYLKDSRDVKVCFDEIKNLKEEDIKKKLNKIQASKQPEENKITLENVDDFQNKEETKNFIKIHYPYPDDTVKVVENYSGKTAKELFEESKDEEGLVSINGFVNNVDVYENSIEPEKKEVKLHNVTDLARRGEFMKLSQKERECVVGLVSSIVNQLAKNGEDKKRLRELPVDKLILKLSKNVFIAPDENIVVLCVPNDPTKDEISAVTKNEHGEYELEDLKLSDNEKTYEGEAYDEKTESNEEENKEKGPSMRKKAPWEKRTA